MCFPLLGGLLAGQHDNQRERPPPARPIQVTFPSLNAPQPSVSPPPARWTESPTHGIAAHFLGLKKPSDVSLDTLTLLNVSFHPETDFEGLLGSVSTAAQAHLPPKSWLDPPEQGVSQPSDLIPTLLCNGRKAPDHNDYYTRAKELLFANEDAFSNLTRMPIGEKVVLRLAHFRKFWEGLDNMAYYWNNSLDQYIPPNPADCTDNNNNNANFVSKPPSSSPNDEEPRKKAKTEPAANDTTSLSRGSAGAGSEKLTKQPSILSSRALPARIAPAKVPWENNMQSASEKPVDLSKGSYKGYRIGNGMDMPEGYRLECVRAFVEPVAWAFGVTLVPHRRPPVLALGHVRFPVRMSTVAWRGPQDRMRARQGWMEGPVLGVQCRADAAFGSTGDLQAESVLDAVRELGGMLLLAQERAREGRVEKRGGQDKWWTTKQRWGGGPGGEVGDGTGASDAPSQDHTPKTDEKLAIKPRLGSKDRKKPNPVEIWKTLRPGNPLWDPKIAYEAIGKDRMVEWDDVSHTTPEVKFRLLMVRKIFMISSLNHHISILKLRIHPLYVQYLTDGTLPKEPPAEADWCSPKLHRTRWYDLFDVNDRTEAMRGLWGVMAYLMRAQEKLDHLMANS